jgi:hypothetical protein
MIDDFITWWRDNPSIGNWIAITVGLSMLGNKDWFNRLIWSAVIVLSIIALLLRNGVTLAP